MAIDLVHCNPDEVFHSASLEDLLGAVQAVDEWTDRATQVLDGLYSSHLARSIRRADRSTLESLSTHISRVLSLERRPRLAGLRRDWPSRWEAFRDAAEGYLEELEQREASNELLERAWVPEVLGLVGRHPQGIAQAELRERLDLRQANTTRILNLLENHELIERRRRGQSKIVLLGPSPLVDPYRPTERDAHAPTAARGLTLLAS